MSLLATGHLELAVAVAGHFGTNFVAAERKDLGTMEKTTSSEPIIQIE